MSNVSKLATLVTEVYGTTPAVAAAVADRLDEDFYTASNIERQVRAGGLTYDWVARLVTKYTAAGA